ncbi:MAG TPA: FAD-dependent monooxygenase, partial [Gammaproteobacteria bacterium]|nr:FAD-dependent monooxygenase [Gammaproteobacteria bacterium]
MEPYDLILVGGGMVGASLACALSGQGLRIAVIEGVAPATRAGPGYDDRAIALAWGTSRILDGLGLWQQLLEDATPIHRIHVSDRGHFGAAHMDRADEGLPAIGYVVPARAIGRVLDGATATAEGIERFCPAQVTGVERGTADIRVHVTQDKAH